MRRVYFLTLLEADYLEQCASIKNLSIEKVILKIQIFRHNDVKIGESVYFCIRIKKKIK